MSFTITYNDKFKVTGPLLAPTVELFQEWRESFLQANDLSKLNLLFMGGTAEQFYGKSKLRTSDIDILMSGDIDEYSLKKIKESALSLGLEKKLLIDTSFITVDIFKKDWGKTEYNVVKLLKKNSITNQFKTITRTFYIDFVELKSGLIQLYKRDQNDSSSYMKHKSRMAAGHYLDLRYDLKTMEQLTFS